MPHRAHRLPDDFPIGTTYVVEGKNDAKGVLRVSARYVLFPDGHKVNLPLKAIVAPPLSPRQVLRPRARRATAKPHVTKQPATKQPAKRPVRERARADA